MNAEEERSRKAAAPAPGALSESATEEQRMQQLWAYMDGLAARSAEALKALEEPGAIEQALYWRARTMGVDLPIDYNPETGALLRRLLASGTVTLSALAAFSQSLRPKLTAARVAEVQAALARLAEEERLRTRAERSGGTELSRHERRIHRAELRRRGGRR
jgi:hypothetical protein